MSDPEDFINKAKEKYHNSLKYHETVAENSLQREHARHEAALKAIAEKLEAGKKKARTARDDAEDVWWNRILTEEQREAYRAKWKAEREARSTK